MKKNYYLLAILFGFGLNQMNAQTYDLNNYKYRFQNYKGLTFNLNLGTGGALSNSNYHSSLTGMDDYANNYTSANSFNLSGSYFKYTNTANLQRNRTFDFNTSANLSIESNDNNSLLITDKFLFGSNFQLRFNEESRFYRNQIHFNYLSLLAYTAVTTNFSKEVINDELVSKGLGNGNRITLDLKLGIGKGRLENVSDAVMALFILQDLEKKLGSKYTSNQLENIAKGITQINNRRYLDFRYKTIEQLTALDSVLQENDLVTDKSILYYTTINDNWLYTNRQLRQSGKRWTYFLNPIVTINNSFENSQEMKTINYYTMDKSLTQSYDGLVGVVYDYSTQKSLYTERSYGFSVLGGINYYLNLKKNYYDSFPPPTDINGPVKNTSGMLYGKLNLYWQHLYQPNSRNILVARVVPSLTYESYLVDLFPSNSDILKQTYIIPQLGINLNYYLWLSPHLNFTLKGSLSGTNSNLYFDRVAYTTSSNGYYLSHSLSAGFVYQLF
jgi:hypothetical protein